MNLCMLRFLIATYICIDYFHINVATFNIFVVLSQQNSRRATHLGIYYQRDDGRPGVSRSCTLDTYDAHSISKLAWSALCKSGKNGNNITSSWLVYNCIFICTYINCTINC